MSAAVFGSSVSTTDDDGRKKRRVTLAIHQEEPKPVVREQAVGVGEEEQVVEASTSTSSPSPTSGTTMNVEEPTVEQQEQDRDQEQQQHCRASLPSSSSSAACPCSIDAAAVASFFISDPITPVELEAVAPVIKAKIETVIALCENSDKSKSPRTLLEEHREAQRELQARRSLKRKRDSLQATQDACVPMMAGNTGVCVAGGPRDYQTALFEIAKQQNTIVHLGTGTGKTLIALLLIQHYHEMALLTEAAAQQQQLEEGAEEESKRAAETNTSSSTTNTTAEDVTTKKKLQTVFLVPSVALALQQTASIRANLQTPTVLSNLTVATAASHKTLSSHEARKHLSQAHVLVATHGAFLDLLSHYGDLFSMSYINLLILDECHNCTGNSVYAKIMKNHYHNNNNCTQKQHRPRVLGLTASPLINVKRNSTDQHLAEQLQTLEQTLDARIVSLRELRMGISSANINNASSYNNNNSSDDSHYSFLLQKEAEEKIIYYRKQSDDSLSSQSQSSFPDKSRLDLLPSRMRELAQLDELYKDLGAYVCEKVCTALHHDLKRNLYENETPCQFETALRHLQDVCSFCQETCRHDTVRLGRTDKLLALEELLEQQMEARADAVGLVFVQRRVTAVALAEYFRRRLIVQAQQEQHGNDNDNNNNNSSSEYWPNARLIRQQQQQGIVRTAQEESMDFDEEEEDDDDQFMDANPEDDPFQVCSVIETPCPLQGDTTNESNGADATNRFPDNGDDDDDDTEDQFGDADSCDDPSLVVGSTMQTPVGQANQQQGNSSATAPPPQTSRPRFTSKCSIRCGALVRRPTNLFKVAQRNNSDRNMIQQNSQAIVSTEETLRTEIIHQEANAREILNGLRRGDINVLVATSVVEEGVDVRACNFVAAFDPISNAKSYVQMKGRARQKHAKFFAFDAINNNNTATSCNSDCDAGASGASGGAPSMILSDLQYKEKAVREFLSNRDSTLAASPSTTIDTIAMAVDDNHQPDDEASKDEAETTLEVSGSSPSIELEAVSRGIYEGPHGTVYLHTAKSLLNRYALAQPMDPAARSSKAALRAYLPAYDDICSTLYLPAHISDPSLRTLELPEQYHQENKKQKKSILALMACVRLHRCGLLSDRLLPLSQEGIQSKIIALATEKVLEEVLREVTGDDLETNAIKTVNAVSDLVEVETVYVYRVCQESDVLDHYRERLGENNLHLAIVASGPLDDVPAFKQLHPEFHEVNFSLATPVQTECTAEQLATLSDFFTLVFNARWNRRTRTAAFEFHPSNDNSSPGCPCYRVGCVNAEGAFLWDYMKLKLVEGTRSQEERTQAVRGLSDTQRLPAPRLWSPEYDDKAMYIVYGPSGERTDAPFPHETENENIRTYQDYFKLEKKFAVPAESQLFEAQRLWHLPSRRSSRRRPKEKLHEEPVEFDGFCEGLVPVRLPKHACFESLMSDAALCFAFTFLPQILYHVERSLCVQAFRERCSKNLPNLGQLLKRLPLSDTFAVLSAKSCEEGISYERLEWLGDAVLKLVQTEVILKATGLRKWIGNMHEGNLNAIRSVLGSNKRLTATCKRLGIDRYVLTAPLARGQWTPSPFILTSPGEVEKTSTFSMADGKICADVVEALLGLAYLHGGYELSMTVAKELEATIPWEDTYIGDGGRQIAQSRPELLNLAKRFTGYNFADHNNRELAFEAFTHPTALNPDTPSYQRLEWIGDAVLCLAARSAIFHKFPTKDVRTMVLMESALVSNETLAFLSLKSGLHKHLIHNDPTMDGRIETYAWTVEKQGRGLWGTDPPKAVADIVEAILGAVHVGGGFSHGQQAVQKVLEPVMNLLDEANVQNALLQHPKRSLLEIGGKMTSLCTLGEAAFARDETDEDQVWLGKEWGTVQRDGHRSVASIQCVGVNLISLVDDTPSSASNRACAFVLAVLKQNPELVQRFQTVRAKVVRSEECQEEEEDVDG